ncbi:winged helix-turn-helix domain-containing protein [Rossellomorea aquimaris]|uniref:ArsR/SmtB family transcription factor n=1 Tax=Rossellomorea aquimaris TaxID=189382 RepID=UPI001CD45B32|nr:winged helix-turn-helix domain-containing protein [Rossellomorea aquimaris]MCA1054407.1 winged helix-turn-helix domain-containing protein [Rossellomorea aquimaris]
MKHLLQSDEVETISLEVESSPVWEVILGISGYTHRRLRHTFDLDEEWSRSSSSMPTSLVTNLDEIEKTNFWYALIMLQNKFSSQSVQEFSNRLSELPVVSFYETLLPYKNRAHEANRLQVAEQYMKPGIFEQYSTYFEHHDFLEGYIRNLGVYSYQQMKDLLVTIVSGWYDWISQNEHWKKWNQALAYEQKRNGSLDRQNPVEEIERVTDGVKYLPEPTVWKVKLIPHVAYRPWILEKRTPDTKLFFYPLKDEYLVSPGTPSSELIRGHKALGDEIRLKLLYQLMKGPHSLQELSVTFNTSKTSLHHQLSLLKAEKFVVVEKGIYSVNPQRIHTFSEKLNAFLGLKDE